MNDFNTYDDDLDEDTMEDRYLTFSKRKSMAWPFATSLRLSDYNALPKSLTHAELRAGGDNLRGAVIPVVDVRLRSGIEQREADERTCVIVVQLKDISVGLIVDTVSEVIDIPGDNVAPP